MECTCTLCRKQSIGKAKTPLSIRLNNHISDVSDPNAT